MRGDWVTKMHGPLVERPHQPDNDPTWVEAYLFDVVQPDGSLAMSIECLLWPQHRRVGFHASVVQPSTELPLISLVDASATAPKPPSLEIRAPGLWTEIGIQTALDHLTVDIEAFAVALDDPDDVFDGAFGVRTALGCELEWETAAEPLEGASGNSYEIPCIVHGELLLDDQVIEIDGWGWRSHRWGAPGPADRMQLRGRQPDGTWLHTQSDQPVDASSTIAVASVPGLSGVGARLEQHFVRTDTGGLAWRRAIT